MPGGNHSHVGNERSDIYSSKTESGSEEENKTEQSESVGSEERPRCVFAREKSLPHMKCTLYLWVPSPCVTVNACSVRSECPSAAWRLWWHGNVILCYLNNSFKQQQWIKTDSQIQMPPRPTHTHTLDLNCFATKNNNEHNAGIWSSWLVQKSPPHPL